MAATPRSPSWADMTNTTDSSGGWKVSVGQNSPSGLQMTVSSLGLPIVQVCGDRERDLWCLFLLTSSPITLGVRSSAYEFQGDSQSMALACFQKCAGRITALPESTSQPPLQLDVARRLSYQQSDMRSGTCSFTQTEHCPSSHPAFLATQPPPSARPSGSRHHAGRNLGSCDPWSWLSPLDYYVRNAVLF